MRSTKILVIKDNELNMKLLKSLLQLENFGLFEAQDAESGIELVKREKPDLNFLNISENHLDSA